MQISGVDFPSRYGGNIRVFLGGPDKSAGIDQLKSDVDKREAAFETSFSQMNSNIDRWKMNKVSQLKALNKLYGPLRAKAFLVEQLFWLSFWIWMNHQFWPCMKSQDL